MPTSSLPKRDEWQCWLPMILWTRSKLAKPSLTHKCAGIGDMSSSYNFRVLQCLLARPKWKIVAAVFRRFIETKTYSLSHNAAGKASGPVKIRRMSLVVHAQICKTPTLDEFH